MRRIKLILSYDGTDYCGWQRQPNGVSIEEVLTEALNRLLHEKVEVIGASRTDSGVHALGNIAVFDTESRIPAEKFAYAVNRFLPRDIVVQSSDEVAADYHPRRCNTVKTYEYRILNRRIPLPQLRRYSHFVYMDLNVERMQKAAQYLCGEHDFKSFCSVRSQAEDTVRTVYQCGVVKDGELITIRICGNGFLYNMVRIIVGTLLRIGTGLWEPEYMETVLEARDRSKAGPLAPANGLTLLSITPAGDPEPYTETEDSWIHYRLTQRYLASDETAVLEIVRCNRDDFEGSLLRLCKRAARNGAGQILVQDEEKRLTAGMRQGYFSFAPADETQKAWLAAHGFETDKDWFVTADPRSDCSSQDCTS